MDALRVISALSVVLIHAVNPVSFSYTFVPASAWWLSNVLNVIGRASVPLFVMLSGALLLSPSRQQEPASLMFKKRLLRIIVIYLLWSAIYFLWRATGLHQTLSYEVVLDSLLAGTPGEQLYFLPLIAGLYIVTPLLRAAIWSLPLRHVWWYTGIAVLMSAVWQYIGSLPGHAPSYNVINQFVPFVGYYLLGFTLTQTSYRPPRWVIWTLYLAGIAIPSLATYLFVSRTIPVPTPYYMYDFLNPFIVAQATGAWLIAQRYYPRFSERYPSIHRWIHLVAGATLGLYLIHLIVLQYVARYIISFPAASHPLTYLAVQVGLAGPIALLIALLLTRTPGIRKLVT
jgi:surface polysaccharide O-acyltransferase-like enzyme